MPFASMVALLALDSSVSSVNGGIGTLPIEVETQEEADGTEGGEDRLPVCRYYLPISGCSAQSGSVGSLLLGSQIFGIVLVALCFAGGGAFGLLRALDNHDWKGWPLAALGASGAFYFFYWGASGWPLLGEYWIAR
jgi:hypothetical protein